MALVGEDTTNFGLPIVNDQIKVVGQLNYAEIFPAWRAVVHHSGAGTIKQLKRVGVGTGRRISTTPEATLITDLRSLLAPEGDARAEKFATRMSTPAHNSTAAAELWRILCTQDIE